MKKLILIEPHGKNGLNVSLTVDGADALESAKDHQEVINVSDLLDNDWGQDPTRHMIAEFGLQPNGKYPQIYTMAHIPYEKEPFLINVFTPGESVNLLTEWSKDPKREFMFIADKQNAERMKEATAKIAAGMWAAYCQQKVNEAALETNERYGILKEALDGIMTAIRALKYDNYNQDDIYYGKVKDLSVEMEKEMDFCLQKMKLIGLLCDLNFESTEVISKLYRKIRGVNETESVKPINSRTDGKENKEDETTEKAVSEENPGTPNPEGNDGSSVGEVPGS